MLWAYPSRSIRSKYLAKVEVKKFRLIKIEKRLRFYILLATQASNFIMAFTILSIVTTLDY